MHDKIFADCDIMEGPFRNKSWQMILMPGDLLLDESDFATLAVVAKSLGDDQFMVVDPEMDRPIADPIVVRWEYEEFAVVQQRSFLSHKDTHCFGLSGEWGRARSV